MVDEDTWNMSTVINLRTGRGLVVSIRLRMFYLRVKTHLPPSPIQQEAGWDLKLVWILGRREKFLVPAGIKP
jgi:hypothetical protein